MYQELFNYLTDQLGAVALETNLQEIEKIILKRSGFRCSNDLAMLLTDLRAAQVNFYAAEPKSEDRYKWLKESKRLEKLLDCYLADFKAQKAPTLFDGQV